MSVKYMWLQSGECHLNVCLEIHGYA